MSVIRIRKLTEYRLSRDGCAVVAEVDYGGGGWRRRSMMAVQWWCFWWGFRALKLGGNHALGKRKKGRKDPSDPQDKSILFVLSSATYVYRKKLVSSAQFESFFLKKLL